MAQRGTTRSGAKVRCLWISDISERRSSPRRLSSESLQPERSSSPVSAHPPTTPCLHFPFRLLAAHPPMLGPERASLTAGHTRLRGVPTHPRSSRPTQQVKPLSGLGSAPRSRPSSLSSSSLSSLERTERRLKTGVHTI